ncbi:hypothetical protein TNCT_481351, partial [Trichonephila clavata]
SRKHTHLRVERYFYKIGKKMNMNNTLQQEKMLKGRLKKSRSYCPAVVKILA